MSKKNRDIIEIFEGVEIRNSNVLRFRVGANKFKEIISEVKRTGLSIPKIISLSGKPCELCKGVEIKAINALGDEVSVKRGIISDYTMQNNGCSILEKKLK